MYGTGRSSSLQQWRREESCGRGLFETWRMRLITGVMGSLGVLFLVYTAWVLTLPERILPTIETRKNMTLTHPTERIIFVGDVHGMFERYGALMRKVKPDANSTVVFVGDFISKGPHSKKMLEDVILSDDIEYKVQCVLGNNELRIMFALLNPAALARYSRMSSERRKTFPFDDLALLRFTTESYMPNLDKITRAHIRLAKELGWTNLSKVSEKCTAMWTFNDLHDDFSLIAVHAGILPDHLENPTLAEITDMKYVDKTNHSHTSREKFKHSTRWYKLWNNEESLSKTTHVVYGHDSSRGLNIRRNTKGLDTACSSGGDLTALEYIWNHKTNQYDQLLHQIPCS